MSKKIDVFVQGEGLKDIVLVKVSKDGLVQDLVEIAKEHGLMFDEDKIGDVFLEDEKKFLSSDLTLKDAKIGDKCHIHIHRCHRIYVSVNFNGQQETRKFPPSATVDRVKKWAAKTFDLSPVDAAEHTLQLTGSDERPDEDIHIGSLVIFPNDQLQFDLVPKVRVEGWLCQNK